MIRSLAFVLALALASSALAQTPAPTARTKLPGGNVKLRCQVAPAYSVTNCQVVSETPPGLNLGATALRMAVSYRYNPKFAPHKNLKVGDPIDIIIQVPAR